MGARLCIAAILAFWAALAPEAGAQAVDASPYFSTSRSPS